MELEPKEKAKQLIFELIENTNPPYKKATFEQSRMCALICVKEMEKVNMKTDKKECLRFVKYWREVKRHLRHL